MRPWFRALVEDAVRDARRTNPPSPPTTPMLQLQLHLQELGRADDVTEREMREAIAAFGVTDAAAVEEALEQFASWL